VIRREAGMKVDDWWKQKVVAQPQIMECEGISLPHLQFLHFPFNNYYLLQIIYIWLVEKKIRKILKSVLYFLYLFP
jgi:predicted XRE-type DNA-binding protein